MPTAVICAAFDAATDAAIAAVRDQLRRLGARAPRNPAHRPHFTLTATTVDDAEVDDVADLAATVATRHAPFRLVLDRIATFGRGTIVWLGPSTAAPLAALQEDAHTALVQSGYRPAFAQQSDPTHWLPHCTLARRVDRRVAATLRAQFAPIDATVAAVVTLLVGGRGDLAHTPLVGVARG